MTAAFDKECRRLIVLGSNVARECFPSTNLSRSSANSHA